MAAVSSNALASALEQPKGSVGAYKELSTSTVLLENELHGTGRFAAASFPK